MSDSYIKQVAEAVRDAIHEYNGIDLHEDIDIDSIISQVPKPDPVVTQHRKPIVNDRGDFIGYKDWEFGNGLDFWPHRNLYADQNLYANELNAQSEIDDLKKTAQEQELMIDSLWEHAKLRESFIEDLLASRHSELMEAAHLGRYGGSQYDIAHSIENKRVK